jgi:hypothetical protein
MQILILVDNGPDQSTRLGDGLISRVSGTLCGVRTTARQHAHEITARRRFVARLGRLHYPLPNVYYARLGSWDYGTSSCGVKHQQLGEPFLPILPDFLLLIGEYTTALNLPNFYVFPPFLFFV